MSITNEAELAKAIDRRDEMKARLAKESEANRKVGMADWHIAKLQAPERLYVEQLTAAIVAYEGSRAAA